MTNNPIDQQENNFRHQAATAKYKIITNSEKGNNSSIDKEANAVAFITGSELPGRDSLSGNIMNLGITASL